MRNKLARCLAISTVLLLAVLGTTLSNNSLVSHAEDPHRDPACVNICFLEFRECFFAATNKHDLARCRSEYNHCTNGCN